MAMHAAIGMAMTSPAAKRLMRMGRADRCRFKQNVSIKASLRNFSYHVGICFEPIRPPATVLIAAGGREPRQRFKNGSRFEP
jgi:ATP phosphoribosyltransferase regulatory subunit HisZ